MLDDTDTARVTANTLFFRTHRRWAQKQIFVATNKDADEYGDMSCALPTMLNSVFCNVTMIDNTPYIARGIFVDAAGNDNNHTFGVIGHKTNESYHFSVVECVTCVVVLNNKNDEECKMTERVFAETYAYNTPIHVMNKEQMRLKYKHILWVGPYLVFECIATDNTRPAHISFGAGSYYDYTREFIMFICGDMHTPTHATRPRVQKKSAAVLPYFCPLCVCFRPMQVLLQLTIVGA